MKQKLFLITIISAVMCLALPILAVADTVPWSTQEYTAYVHGEEHDGDVIGPYVTMTGPPLPISASDSNSFGGGMWSLDSTIYSTSLNIYLSRSGIVDATVSAEFLGTYTADDPFFNFTYDIVETLPGSSYWLTVDDLTDVTTIYSSELSVVPPSDPASIFVPTIAGHEIGVNFGIYKSVGMFCCTETFNSAMAYNMAVVPEPISSTLFIIGGATLGFRRFRKRA